MEIDNSIYEIIKTRPEYQNYIRKKRFRGVIFVLIAVLLWGIVAFSVIKESQTGAIFTNVIIALLGTAVGIRFALSAFLTRPVFVMEGEITDTKEVKEITKKNGKEETSITQKYLVRNGNRERWGECINEFLYGNSLGYNIGEQVYLFSISPKETYIMSKNTY